MVLLKPQARSSGTQPPTGSCLLTLPRPVPSAGDLVLRAEPVGAILIQSATALRQGESPASSRGVAVGCGVGWRSLGNRYDSRLTSLREGQVKDGKALQSTTFRSQHPHHTALG